MYKFGCSSYYLLTINLLKLMKIKVIVQKVSNVSEDKLNLTARDETGGITRFSWQKKNGIPQVGDEVELCYMRTTAKKIVGMVWNGQTFSCAGAVA